MANAPLQFIHISGIETDRGIFISELINHKSGLETSKMRKSTLKKWKRDVLEVEWEYKPKNATPKPGNHHTQAPIHTSTHLNKSRNTLFTTPETVMY